MAIYKYIFYRDGNKVYTCYTKTDADSYSSELGSRGVDYSMRRVRVC